MARSAAIRGLFRDRLPFRPFVVPVLFVIVGELLFARDIAVAALFIALAVVLPLAGTVGGNLVYDSSTRRGRSR